MCGIAGVFHYRTQRPVDPSLVERLTDKLVHRGPDQSGTFIDGELAFGHRRLSIIDLSEAGRQPMTNEDGNVVVTFNGEIYNFAQLRADLVQKGHHFRSSSDTEVLVHLWEEEGPAMVDALVGMFAFAIFDRKERTLLLARDRLGEKPLYWAPVSDGIIFASEVHALSEDPRFDPSLDEAALTAYLERQYVPSPLTIYRGARALEPATYAIFQAGREPALKSYWTARPRTDLPRHAEDRRRLVEEELAQVVRSRTIADVPVGCFLSSGIDSSLVAYHMQRAAGKPVLSFSIGFEERGYDESAASSETARELGVRHTVEIVKAPTFETLQGILQRYGQPFGDSAAIPTYFLSQVARREVTVALSGDGGDEAFCGYERYRLMLLANSLKWLPGASSAGETLLHSGAESMSAPRVLGRALLVASSSGSAAYQTLTAPFSAREILLLGRGRGSVPIVREQAAFQQSTDATSAAQLADLATNLPDCLTTKVDIASMAHSLEVRAPFLDHRLIELGLALPRRERVKLRRTKVLLRKIATAKLGPALGRRPKRGFSVPLEVWLRGSMRKQVQDFLLGPSARVPRVLQGPLVAQYVDRFFQGDRALHARVWVLLALEAWLRSDLGRRAVA